MLASNVVLSTLFPSASFSSTPVNSMKAPLVPEPSSLETTEISLDVSNPVSELALLFVPALSEFFASEFVEPHN